MNAPNSRPTSKAMIFAASGVKLCWIDVMRVLSTVVRPDFALPTA